MYLSDFASCLLRSIISLAPTLPVDSPIAFNVLEVICVLFASSVCALAAASAALSNIYRPPVAPASAAAAIPKGPSPAIIGAI